MVVIVLVTVVVLVMEVVIRGDVSHGQPNRPNSDCPRNNRGFGRDSSGAGRGRDSGPRFCTHCNQDNHIVNRCYDLHGCLATHQAIVVLEADVATNSTDEYQRLLTSRSFPATTTLVQTSTSTACTTFQSLGH